MPGSGHATAQILDVKEVYALAEDLRLMIFLDPEALPGVPPPDTLFKDCQNILVRHGLRRASGRAELAKPGLTSRLSFRKSAVREGSGP